MKFSREIQQKTHKTFSISHQTSISGYFMYTLLFLSNRRTAKVIHSSSWEDFSALLKIQIAGVLTVYK